MKISFLWLEKGPQIVAGQIWLGLFLYGPQAKNGFYISKRLFFFFLSMQQRPYVACKTKLFAV